MATSQTPGNRPSSTSQSPEEDDQTGPGATRRFTEEESRVIQLLERISNNQERILSFLSERANPEYGLHQTAQSLWDSPHHAWSTSVRESEAPKDNSLGSAFFNSIAPCGTSFIESFPPSSGVKLQNLSLARNEFENWIKRSRSERWIEAHFRTYDAARTISNVGQWWPSMWKVSRLWNRPCCSSQEVSYAFPDSFQNPLHCTTVSHGAIEKLPETSLLDGGREAPLCGIMFRVSVRRSPGILDFDCIAAMLCLVRSRGFDNCPDFLDAHIGGWEEWPMQDRHGLKSFQSSTLSVGPSRNNPGNIVYGRYLHYLRSFTVVDFDENRAHEGPDHAGLKCAREWVTIEGLYRDSILKLVERRYSVALNFLPLQRPCGHYALVSVADTSDNDIPRVWNVSLDFGRRNTGTNRETPWKTFGIQPAGLYTGVSVFQVQICAFIASWRDDWITTVDAVDGMVSVSLDDMRDNKRLRSLVLDTNPHSPVSYFKVLRTLGIFSDSVRATYGYLETLSQTAQKPWVSDIWLESSPWRSDIWLESSYPHTNETRRILAHNWNSVLRHQEEASNIVLKRLERTTNEVQGLMDGLFSVQTVTEAQKSRMLNKYILVFTIITIIFLPPTFVSTFFGVAVFESTRTTFWTVFIGLSGVSYVGAALGLFWSSLSSDDRLEWSGWVASRSRSLKEPLRAFGRRENQPTTPFPRVKRRQRPLDQEDFSLEDMNL